MPTTKRMLLTMEDKSLDISKQLTQLIAMFLTHWALLTGVIYGLDFVFGVLTKHIGILYLGVASAVQLILFTFLGGFIYKGGNDED